MFILSVLIDTLKDTWLMLPLLFITYCILEVYERKPQNDDDTMFYSLQKYGPVFAALLGLIPQCGFSIIAAMLFLQNNITLGSLIAVMIATSDEAIPILLSNPSLYGTLVKLLVLKFVIAVIVGYFVDYVLFRKQSILLFDDMIEEEYEEEDDSEDASNNACPCCYTQYPLVVSAFLRSIKIYVFIFLTTIALSLGMEMLGSDLLSKILLKDSIFQPCIAALFGFIPNCAITVVLAQLFSLHELQFGSLLAGLVTNAGMGLICLIRYGGTKKDIYRVIIILYISAIIVGFIF